jgi:hypothetical protein
MNHGSLVAIQTQQSKTSKCKATKGKQNPGSSGTETPQATLLKRVENRMKLCLERKASYP